MGMQLNPCLFHSFYLKRKKVIPSKWQTPIILTSSVKQYGFFIASAGWARTSWDHEHSVPESPHNTLEGVVRYNDVNEYTGQIFFIFLSVS